MKSCDSFIYLFIYFSAQSTDRITLRSCSAETDVMDEPSRDDDDPQSHLEASQSPVCAKNSSRMPSGEKVVLWTRWGIFVLNKSI